VTDSWREVQRAGTAERKLHDARDAADEKKKPTIQLMMSWAAA
jgi:hypothetical protein